MLCLKKMITVAFVFAALLLPLSAQNTCLEFDGVDDYVQTPLDLQPTALANTTWEAWIKPTRLFYPSHQGILSTDDGGWDRGIWIAPDSDQLLIGYGTAGWNPGVSLTADEWYHIVIVYKTDNVLFYLNGVEHSLGQVPVNQNTTLNLMLGISSGALFQGQMDEVRIWNTIRTEQEIQENMDNTLIGNESGLVAYYNLNEGSGSVAGDSAGNNDGTLVSMDDSDWVASSIFIPTFQSLTPSNNSLNINPQINLQMSFDRNVIEGEGNIEIYKALDDSIFETIAVSSSTIIDSIVTIDPISNFELNTNYYVLIDSTAFMSEDSVYFSGIRDENTWAFKTEAVTFTPAGAGFINSFATSCWGDIDNDNDLDVVVSYSDSVIVYDNNGGIFTPVNSGISGYYSGSIDLGDYDNDGDLDILITGITNSTTYISRIYRNDSGYFTDIEANLVGVKNGCGKWGDYDRDGDLDIVTLGEQREGNTTYGSFTIYRNDSGVFTDIAAPSYGIFGGSADWGDYDNDGDLDVLFSGSNKSYIFRNDNGTYLNINAGLTGLFSPSVSWGDYDNDGDLDALISSSVYNNENGIFTEIFVGNSDIQSCSSSWGDFDNDGDLDIIYIGSTGYGEYYTELCQNNYGVFTKINNSLPNISGKTATFGDYDNDGDLDILLMGSRFSTIVAEIYTNNISFNNAAPSAPLGLDAELTNNILSFSYNKATDSETPQNGLSYNIDIRMNDNIKIVSGVSDIASGYRRVVDLGNANQLNIYDLKLDNFQALPQEITNVNWGVQSVDQCFTGSEFTESELQINISSDLNTSSQNEMVANDILSWEFMFQDSIANYTLQLDADTIGE
jgi:hypothetical protein